jgi:hypothetical protein
MALKLSEGIMKRSLFLALLLFASTEAFSFCGFFVGKADSKLFNQASKVILVRDENRTVLTMANDYQGELKDFALVVPVPVVLQKDQVHIGDSVVIERLDAFSAPRLVEYFDNDPCYPADKDEKLSSLGYMQNAAPKRQKNGVTVEAKFTVGEYDIVILGADESAGLETWLIENGYKIPKGAADVLEPYIKTKTKFFVAKVNLGEFENKGLQHLRPLQMAFESPKFMLPIRLGMINAEKEQDLIVYALSRTGRVEVTNYRTLKIPSDMDIPVYVKDVFPQFYRSMFQRAYEKEGKNAVFVEYAWDMNWCDPCSADPLTPDELRKAGVFWLDQSQQSNAYITRLHVRYGRANFPEDLIFQATPNRENFQGRYVMRHPFAGKITCDTAKTYMLDVRGRQEKEARRLAVLTGWDLAGIRTKAGLNTPVTNQTEEEKSWWRKIFNQN